MTENGARFDRNPYVVASYLVKLSLEIRSVILKKKKRVIHIYISKFFHHIKSCRGGGWCRGITPRKNRAHA